MGKVRTDTVKRAARELVEKYPDKFTGEYETNKLAANEVLRAPSKKLRNRIAGYVTRLKVTEANKASMMQSPEAQLGLAEEEEESQQDTASAEA